MKHPFDDPQFSIRASRFRQWYKSAVVIFALFFHFTVTVTKRRVSRVSKCGFQPRTRQFSFTRVFWQRATEARQSTTPVEPLRGFRRKAITQVTPSGVGWRTPSSSPRRKSRAEPRPDPPGDVFGFRQVISRGDRLCGGIPQERRAAYQHAAAVGG